MNACRGTLTDLFILCFLIKMMLHNKIYPYLLNKTKLTFEFLTMSVTFQSSTQLCIYHVPPDNVLIPKHHLLAGQYWQLRPCLKCFLGWCHCLQHLCLCGFWYPWNYLQYWNIMTDRSFWTCRSHYLQCCKNHIVCNHTEHLSALRTCHMTAGSTVPVIIQVCLNSKSVHCGLLQLISCCCSPYSSRVLEMVSFRSQPSITYKKHD